MQKLACMLNTTVTVTKAKFEGHNYSFPQIFCETRNRTLKINCYIALFILSHVYISIVFFISYNLKLCIYVYMLKEVSKSDLIEFCQ